MQVSSPQMIKKIKDLAKDLHRLHGTEYCNNHENVQLKWPLRVTETCLSCQTQLCYVCGINHQRDKCHLLYPTWFTTGQSVSSRANYELNIGQPMLLDLSKTACPCGNPIRDSVDSVICVACGSATCSQKCHFTHIASKSLCLFFMNFSNLPMEGIPTSLPSISLKHINKALYRGTKDIYRVNSTSASMLSCYLFEDSKFGRVILQRGIRQMGNPVPTTLQNLKILDSPLDYHLFTKRSCFCQCSYCKMAGLHNCERCELQCLDPEWIRFRQSQSRKVQSCDCDCVVCGAAKIACHHTRDECKLHCEKPS